MGRRNGRANEMVGSDDGTIHVRATHTLLDYGSRNAPNDCGSGRGDSRYDAHDGRDDFGAGHDDGGHDRYGDNHDGDCCCDYRVGTDDLDCFDHDVHVHDSHGRYGDHHDRCYEHHCHDFGRYCGLGCLGHGRSMTIALNFGCIGLVDHCLDVLGH
mgnify:CR=1 FL=1